MNINEIKTILEENSIQFYEAEYSSEKEYFKHAFMFSNVNKASSCRVKVLVIESKNSYKNIELQFNDVKDDVIYVEMNFGGYIFDTFDCKPELLAEMLLKNIFDVMSGKMRVVIANNLKKKCWCGDALFDMTDSESKESYLKAVEKIESPKGFFDKLFNVEIQYEIFDWNTYNLLKK